MTSIAWNGGPIFRNGAVGTGQDCCCSTGEYRICSCNALAPREVVVTITVGDVIPANTFPPGYDDCLDADFKDFIDGSYVLSLEPLSGPDAPLYYGSSGLSACGGNDCTDLLAILYCYVGPLGSHAYISINICDQTRDCFNQIVAVVYFMADDIPNACSFGTETTFTKNGAIQFWQKFNCLSNDYYATKSYEATFDIEIIY